ncbi:MAG: RNA methyltransferase [Anaerolineae bacterium]|nr:RNA methyltransferase [Anaerolineae bacterium]
MTKITSLQNDKVRRVQSLQHNTRRRRRDGLMIAEGVRLVQEVIRSQLPVTEVFYTPDSQEDLTAQQMIFALQERDIPTWEVPLDVMAVLSDTETPQGILVVLPIPQLSPVGNGGLTLIPDRVRDPGNLGTMLRTAWAAGCNQVFIPPGTVDPTNPKVVRSGMGAHFFLPIQRATWPVIRSHVKGCQVWLAEAENGTSYRAIDWQMPLCIIIGGEAEGASAGGRELAEGHYVYIPMAPGVESLNAAVAAAILLFAASNPSRCN